MEGVGVAVAVAVGVAVVDMLGVAEALAVAVVDILGVAEAVAVAVGDIVGVGVAEAVAVAVEVVDIVGDADAVSVAVVVGVGDGDGSRSQHHHPSRPPVVHLVTRHVRLRNLRRHCLLALRRAERPARQTHGHLRPPIRTGWKVSSEVEAVKPVASPRTAKKRTTRTVPRILNVA